VCAIARVDFEDDGKLDIMLGGDVAKVRAWMGRNDANLGRIFLNQSRMNFDYLSQPCSGQRVMDDVRSLSGLNQSTEFKILIRRNGLPLKTRQIAEKR
jgi:hypothetical protein